jgi:hypothetical protein
MKAQIAVLAAMAGIIGWLVWTPLRQLAGERDILKRYSNVHAGMTLDQVSRVMERPPDCVMRVGSARVAYFATMPSNIDRWPVCRAGGSEIARWEDLPAMYAALEVAFDRSGRLVAHGTCGEGEAPLCLRYLPEPDRPK